MNKYEITMESQNPAEERILMYTTSLTFAEAAQRAYLERHKLGFNYKILSIVQKNSNRGK